MLRHHRATSRLRLLAPALAVAVAIAAVGGPTQGAAAEPTPAPSGSPAVSSAPSAVPSVPVARPASVAPSTTLAPTPAPPAGTGPTPAAGAYPSQCLGWSGWRERADLAVGGRFKINVHPVVQVPMDPAWTENPLADANWEYQFHAQWLALNLFQAWHEIGDRAYLDRAAFLLRDWWTDNPRSAPRSRMAWDKMGTALRAQVLACATRYLPVDGWLADAIDGHAAALADPAFYANEGNWALNQNLGLLELAVARKRADWQSLAVDRLTRLFEQSVDAQGVTNEQSVWYQFYNWDRYRVAFGRLEALGIPLPATASRHRLMPNFLAYATLPNGEYEMIGDLDRIPARAIPGTLAEYAATKGASGTKPGTVAVYRAGWLFARSGWGERRAWADEVTVSLRWGPRPIIHGHADHGSITLYGFGSRLLIDPGKYTYNWGPDRAFFKGRTAHNVVTVDGVAWDKNAASTLLNHSNDARKVTARVKMTGNPGVTHVRGIVFSRALDYVLVEDRLTSSRSRTYRQLWHLTEDAKPLVYPTWFRTQRGRGNVQVRQLLNGSTSRVVAGRTNPVQGWLAWEHGKKLKAPVVEVARSGGNVRFLTLIVPAAGTPGSGVSNLQLTSTGYRVTIRIGSRSERVVVDGSTVTITPLN